MLLNAGAFLFWIVMKRALNRESTPNKKPKREPKRDEPTLPPPFENREYSEYSGLDFEEDWDLPPLEAYELNIDLPHDVLCGVERCDPCFERSMASHRRVASFLAANPSANVFEVAQRTHTVYQWQCFDCDHCFKETCFSVTLGIWCPKCADRVYE